MGIMCAHLLVALAQHALQIVDIADRAEPGQDGGGGANSRYRMLLHAYAYIVRGALTLIVTLRRDDARD